MTAVYRKDVTLPLKGVDDAGTGVAQIATLGVVDHDGDIILPHAFDFGGPQTVPMLGYHKWDRPPAGKATITESGDAALAHFRLNLRSEAGRAIYDHLRFDFETQPSRAEFSFGFTVPAQGAETRTLEDGQRVRLLKKLQVHEVSVVLKGAGINTGLLALKSSDGDDDLIALVERIAARIPTAPPEVLPATALLATRARSIAQGLMVDELADVEADKGAFRYILTTLPVEDPRRIFAVRYLKAACAELGGLPEPNLRFFRPAHAEESPDFCAGELLSGACLSSRKTVAVAESVGLTDLAEVVGHEVAHLGRPHATEAEIDVFARRFAAEYSVAPSGLAKSLARAAVLGELARLRGWSSRELTAVLQQV